MGEMMNGSTPEDDARINTQGPGTTDPGKVDTDVSDVKADGTKQGIPVFDVDAIDFIKNMRMDRRNLKFPEDSAITQYMRGTRYSKPFWLRTKNGDAMRKVK
jgi:hypothetical protein